MKSSILFIYRKDCGTGAGGFKPGNTCGRGDGSSSGSEGSGKKGDAKQIAQTIAKPRQEVSIEEVRELTDALTSELDFATSKDEAIVQHAKLLKESFSESLKTLLSADDPERATVMATVPAASAASLVSRMRASMQRDFVKPAQIDAVLKEVTKQCSDMAKQLGGKVAFETVNAAEWKTPYEKAVAAMTTVQGLAAAHGMFERTQGKIDIDWQRTEKIVLNGRVLDKAGACATPDGKIKMKPLNLDLSRYEIFDGHREVQFLVHEITHQQHNNAPANANTGTSRRPAIPERRTPLSPSQRTIARGIGGGQQIRDYGLTNPAEYVACFVEALHLGAQFDEDQWKLYDEFNGPRIRKSVREARTYRTEERDRE